MSAKGSPQHKYTEFSFNHMQVGYMQIVDWLEADYAIILDQKKVV